MNKVTVAKVAVSAALFAIDRPYDYLVPSHLLNAVTEGVRVIVPFSRGNRRCEGIVLAVLASEETAGLKCIEAALDESPVLSSEQIKLALWMHERFFCTVYEAVKAILPAGLWYKISDTYKIAEGVDRAKAYEAAGNSEIKRKVLDSLYENGGEAGLRTISDALGRADASRILSQLIKNGIVTTDFHKLRRTGDKTIKVAALAVVAEEAADAAAGRKKRAPLQSAVLELLSQFESLAVTEIRYFTGASQAAVHALEKNGYIEIFEKEIFRRPAVYGEECSAPELSPEQLEAFEGLENLRKEGRAGAALLYGVTGSGKTSIYIHLIDRTLAEGKSAIVLVPEIALTPQLMNTFAAHFGDKVAVLHSSLGAGERYDEWKRIRSGLARVVVGTRSAVFAPVLNPGIIIIDEEQENTYKSENSPRYHARDVAKYRCSKNGALLLLGSATPSVESMFAAREGTYSLFRLEKRYNRKELPQTIIVDMKKELRNGNGGLVSSVLRRELEKNISAGEQSILFINRRGESGIIACGECGYTCNCPRCSVSLTYHSANRRLMCHYCGYSEPLAGNCPQCGGLFRHIGAGTQKAEDELRETFPDIPLLRMDTDTVSSRGTHEEILSKFERQKIPILIGTQMVTKGLNFENVTLVGILSADQALYLNDYRAHERAFSLMTQVTGRSGRGDKTGRAVLQTFTPNNEVIRLAARQDYDGFFNREIELRKILGCPPAADLFSVTASGLDESAVLNCCAEIKRFFVYWLKDIKETKVLGPAPAGIAKINNRYRYRVTVSGKDSRQIRTLVSGALRKYSKDKRFRGVSIFGDMNPTD